MLQHNYKERKAKVEEILDNTKSVEEVDKFPRDQDFTYSNGYKAWASAIFVDLRDSTSLFSNEDEVKVAKVVRGFTSEIIEILKKDANDTELKEIGIRGDCVYAVYSTPKKADIQDVADRAIYINTYMKMLNKLLVARALPIIKAGIGLAAHPTLAVKAGRHSSGVHNLVWVGKSVASALKLSDLGNKNNISPIVMSDDFYFNYSSKISDEAKTWWSKEYDSSYGEYHHGNVIKTEFNDWIKNGMNN
ncbi:adenylate cyclase [Paenibacillus sp. CFBP13512]|nr:adenylate cyclase [Paenibacillus sp. CFBP13512]